MKLLLLFAILTLPLAAATDREKLMRCIIQVEGHRWSDPGGAAGMKLSTWRDRTRQPYARASIPWRAMPVYVRHLDWLIATLGTDDPASVGSAWRWGVEGSRRRLHDDYGQRVANLYGEK